MRDRGVSEGREGSGARTAGWAGLLAWPAEERERERAAAAGGRNGPVGRTGLRGKNKAERDRIREREKEKKEKKILFFFLNTFSNPNSNLI